MQKRFGSALLVLFSIGSFLFMGLVALAQEATATISISETGELGRLLTDGEGRTLYASTGDQTGVSFCYFNCLESWPPLLTQDEPIAGEGVDPSLLGTLERTDGSLQVTYNGQPLYYSHQDAGAGQTSSQGAEAFGGVWYVISPEGILVGDEPSTDAALGDENLQELMTAGEEIFVDSCSVCHSRGTGPVLEGNQKLENIEYVVSTILNGRANGAMPAWGNVLSDDQIAAVATYIRNHGENAFGPVAPEQVQLRRQGH